MAQMCGLSERAVQGHVRGLVKAGILRPRLRIGHATRYTVHLDGLSPLVFASAPGGGVVVLDDAWQGAGAVNRPAPTPAVFAAPAAENDTPPPQISPLTPAESAPITVLNIQQNTEGTGAPALPAVLKRVDGVRPEVLADFAAIRQAKRMGPVTAVVIEAIGQQARLAGLSLEQALQTCCDPRRRWARFEASWLSAAPGGFGVNPAATITTVKAPALWKRRRWPRAHRRPAPSHGGRRFGQQQRLRLGARRH